MRAAAGTMENNLTRWTPIKCWQQKQLITCLSYKKAVNLHSQTNPDNRDSTHSQHIRSISVANFKKGGKAFKGVSIESSSARGEKKCGLDEALEDVRAGRVSGPFNSMDELMSHLTK